MRAITGPALAEHGAETLRWETFVDPVTSRSKPAVSGVVEPTGLALARRLHSSIRPDNGYEADRVLVACG
ncbi:MAG: hypothetical protein ACI8TX_001246 [Hyphomicrobiaceae bacterium]|jgi:hypothetical protein